MALVSEEDFQTSVEKVHLYARSLAFGTGQQKDTSRATQILEGLVRICPTDMRVHHDLHDLYRDIGDFPSAVRVLRWGAYLTDERCLFMLGMAYVDGLGTDRDVRKGLNYLEEVWEGVGERQWQVDAGMTLAYFNIHGEDGVTKNVLEGTRILERISAGENRPERGARWLVQLLRNGILGLEPYN